MSTPLAQVNQLRVPHAVVADTWSALRGFGRKGCEGFVLWLGKIENNAAVVQSALVPPQESIRSEDGVGYFVTTQTLFQLNVHLSTSGLRLLAQVHSHPTEAYHSDTDDRYAVVTTEGGFSIVVPDFAEGPPLPERCAIYRLCRGTWQELDDRQVANVCAWELK